MELPMLHKGREDKRSLEPFYFQFWPTPVRLDTDVHSRKKVRLDVPGEILTTFDISRRLLSVE
jgi:hypothetical protein